MLPDFVWTFIAYVAAIGVWIRFRKFFSKENPGRKNSIVKTPLVSIVVPVRNEEAKIRVILESLLRLDYPCTEIIVADDGSTDNTKEIARGYPVSVISTPPRPKGWNGKSWACQAGSEIARGELILFTDADTIHLPDELDRAVAFLLGTGSNLVSCVPYHLNNLWWEKYMGIFYCLLYAGISPFDRISDENPYALGPYLLIEKEFYVRIGRHSSIRGEMADDVSLARVVIQKKGKYSLYTGTPLYKVQMFNSFREFWKGWHRLIRMGMKELRWQVMVNTLIPLLALNIPNLFIFSVVSLIPVIATLICLAGVQKKIGVFSYWGVLVFPVTVLFFGVIATSSAISHLLNLPIEWRGRRYSLRSPILNE